MDEYITINRLLQCIFTTIPRQEMHNLSYYWWYCSWFLFWSNKLGIVNSIHTTRNFVFINFPNLSKFIFRNIHLSDSRFSGGCAVHNVRSSVHSIHIQTTIKRIEVGAPFRSGKCWIFVRFLSCWNYSGSARFIRWNCVFGNFIFECNHTSIRWHDCPFREQRMADIFIRNWNSTRNFLRSNLFGNLLHLC